MRKQKQVRLQRSAAQGYLLQVIDSEYINCLPNKPTTSRNTRVYENSDFRYAISRLFAVKIFPSHPIQNCDSISRSAERLDCTEVVPRVLVLCGNVTFFARGSDNCGENL